MDPSLYALQVSLSLESGAAFASLDDFSDRVLRIEGAVAEAGKKAVSDIGDTIQSVEENLSKVISQIKEIDGAGTKGFEFAKNAYDNFADIEDVCQRELEWLDEYQKGFEELVQHSTDLSKTSAKELKSLDQFSEKFEQIIALIDKKNKGHEDELNLVTKEQNLADQLADSVKEVGKGVDKSRHSHMKLLGALHDIWSMVRAIDEETENFITTNYRAYGTQQQLVQATRSLTMEYGILRGASIEAFKVLGNLKMPLGEIRKYAAAIGMATRYTGVGVGELSQFAFRMRQVGWDAAKTEAHLRFTAEAMRKFGLDSKDVNSILNGTKISAAELNRIFGAGSADKILEMQTVVVGLAKNLGFASDKANEFINNLLSNPLERAKFGVFAEQTINSAADMEMAIAKSSTKAAQQLAALREQYGDNSAAIQIAANEYAKANGMVDHANMEMLAGLNDAAKALGVDIQTTAGWAAVKAELYRRSIDPFVESNQTLTAQLNILRDRLVAIVEYGIQPVCDALMEAVKWLNVFLTWIIDVGNGINQWWTNLTNIFPELKALTYWLKLGAGAVLALGAAFIVLGAVFGLIPGMIGMMTSGIIGLFRGIGLGIQAFGRAIASVMVPLLAMGATFLMVGAGIYLLAQAFQIVTAQGWQGIGMFAVLAVIIAGLGLAMVGLGAIAKGPVALGMIVVAGVFLALGAAALMAGFGMKLFAQSLEIISAVGMSVIKPLFALAGAMAALGVAGFVAGPGIMLMAVGMWLLAPAILLVGAGMTMLAGAIKAVNFSTVVESGQALMVAAGLYAAAGVMLIGAGVALAVGAAVTLAASVTLATGSVAMIAASVLLGVAAVAVGIGSVVLVGSGLLLGAASGLMVLSGGLLVMAAGYLTIGAAQLTASLVAVAASGVTALAAAAALGVASVGMLASGALLLGSGVVLTVAGGAIMAGGLLLSVGATMVQTSSDLLAAAGATLGSISAIMGSASAGLLAAGATLVAASAALLAGGVAIAPAAIAIRAGIWVMQGAVQKLSALTPQLTAFSGGMHTLSESLGIIERIKYIAPTLQAFAGSAMLLVGAFTALDAIPTDALSQIATDSLAAMPGLMQFVTEFEAVANKLSQTAESVISSTESINTAIAKASPALAAVGRTAMADVRSEAIHTVQIMDQREGSRENDRDETSTAMLETLRKILEAIMPLDNTQIASIRDLLEQRLPSGEPTGSNFASHLNSWRR